MLEDRSYMRASPFNPRRSATVTFLLVNLAVFLLKAALDEFTKFPTNKYLALSLDGLKNGFVWQLLTYQFMHANFIHLFLNCWAIYVFGHDVEEALGRNSYVALYLLSGVFGGLVQIGAGLLISPIFGTTVVGASAAAFGLCAAFAMLFPDRILLLFFVIPLRAKYLLALSAGLAVLGAVTTPRETAEMAMQAKDRVAHAAHLGGLIAGLIFIRYASHWDWHLPRFRRPSRKPSRSLVKVTTIKGGLWGKTKPVNEEELPAEEFLSKEVDPILDKISAHGIQSLTERERRILEAARQRMGKR